jgi:capsular exopolysaccharide synthesis family protein
MIDSEKQKQNGHQNGYRADYRRDLMRNGYSNVPSLAPAHGSSPKEEADISLHQVITVLRRRATVLAGATTITALATSAVILTRPVQYTGTFRLLVEPVTQGSRLADSLTSDTLQTLKPLAQKFDSSGGGLDYVSQIEVLKSQTILDPILQEIQKRYPEIDYETLTKRLKISRPKDSKVLDFTYDSPDKEEIKFVLEELSKAYLKYSIDDRKSNLKRGIEFVNEQIERQREDVGKREAAMQRFRQQNTLIDPEKTAGALADQIRAIASAREDNRVKLAAAKTLFLNLQQQLGTDPETAVSISTLSESPNYRALLAQLRDLESKIATERARFRDNTPQIEALLTQRQNLLPLLQQEASRAMGGVTDPEFSRSIATQGSVQRELTQQYIDAANQVQVLATQDAAITQAVNDLNQRTQLLAGVSREYGQIQRDLTIATQSLARLLTARENLQLETARQEAPWQMISKLDDRNILPKASLLLLLLVGVLASIIVGVAVALLVEQLDRVYHTVEDLKDTKLPCLGVVPFNPELNKVSSLIEAQANSKINEMSARERGRSQRYQTTFLEAFYSLDANIRLLSSDSPVRTVTISSTSPADGKSTISSHLAWAAVTMGRKVLIVDTDLRRPQVHKWFDLPNMRGLSNAITSDIDVMDVVQQSPHEKNLYILPAGPTPPAPGRLLASNKMRQFMDRFQEEFDFVIYDAPPLLGFADAKLIIPQTDGLLLVVGLGKTDRGNLIQVLDEIRSTTHAPILGIVANGLKRYTIGYYYYQHYYNQQGNGVNIPVSTVRDDS